MVRTREGLMCPASWSEILFSDLWMGQVPIADSFPLRSHCWNSSQLWASGNLPPLLQSIALQTVLMASCVRSMSSSGQGTCAHCHQWENSSLLCLFVLSLQRAVQGTVFYFLRKELGTIFWAFKSPETIGQVLSSFHPVRC